MDSNYPNRIDNFQTKENESGSQYDPSETTVQFAEDINKTNGAVRNIESTLGTNPAGGFETVGARLEKISEVAEQPVIFTIAPAVENFAINGSKISVSISDCQFSVGDNLIFLPAQTLEFTATDNYWIFYINKDYEFSWSEGTYSQVMNRADSDVLIPLISLYAINYGGEADIDEVTYTQYITQKTAFESFSAFGYTKTTANTWRSIRKLGEISGLTPMRSYQLTITCASCSESGFYGFQDSGYSEPEFQIKGSGTANLGSASKIIAFANLDGVINLFFCASGSVGAATLGDTQIYAEPYDF